MGKHPYSSPQRIWERLAFPGILAPQQSDAMLLGIEFEPAIARYASKKLGVKVRANTVTHELRSQHLCATPDYYVLGQHGLLEVKLSGITYGWDDETLHPHYEYQARAQMACTNRDFVIFAVLVGSRFFSPIVTRDMDKERAMLSAVNEFWVKHVETGIAPGEGPQLPLIATVTKG
jgi:predicted phage-related endonuclease